MKATGDLDIFNKKAKESEKTTNGLDSAFKSLSPSALAAVAGVTALVGAVKSLIGVGSHMMDITSHFEQTQKSLETVLQSAEKGQKLFEDLRKFSFDTTFGVDELASASSQLLNAGMAVNGLNDNLKMLGDLAQGDKNKFQELTSIFAKVQNTGRATSIQLQQLALRGIPIQKTLREMGVTGVASAEDLTKAFEKLTGEGGQFHDAMNNIIDTIEGKRGFISDTLKEIAVNFGEVSGLTEAYKATLDKLYEAVEWVNNKLMEWNDNPVAKAILRGTLITVITTLITLIGVGLAGALAKIIGMLVTINALSGPTGWIALGVAGIAGLTVGVVSYVNSLKDANKVEQEHLDLLEEQAKIQYGQKPKLSREQQLEVLENDRKIYQDSLNRATLSLQEAEKEMQNFDKYYDELLQSYSKAVDTGQYKGLSFLDWIEKNKDYLGKNIYGRNLSEGALEFAKSGNLAGGKTAISERISDYNLQITIANKSLENTQEEIDIIQEKIKAFGDTNALKSVFDEVYKEANKTQQSLDEILEKKAKIEMYLAQNGRENNQGVFIKFTEGEKEQINKALKYLKTEAEKLTIKLKIENAEDWMKTMQKAFGFDDKTLAQLVTGSANGGISGGQATRDYVQKLVEQSRAEQKVNELLGWNQGKTTKDYTTEVVKEAMKTYQALLSSGQFGIGENGKLDKTTQEMMEQIKSLEQVFKASGGTEEEWQKLVGNYVEDTTNKLMEQKSVWEQLTDSATAYFQSLGFGKETAQQFGQLVSNIASMSLDSLVNSCEAIGDALARGTDVGDAMKRQFASFLAQVTKSISVTCIQAGLSLIAQSGWAGVPAALGLFALGGVSAMASGFINGITNTTEQDKHNQTVKDLTDSYKKLQEAIKEQEEYYIRKKAELNMLDITDKVTKVNDMILTPHGTFSTSPQDTIIATKNPQGLGGGVVNNIKVINNAGVDVNVRENKGNNMNEILVTISKKIASDVAGGYNGWDSAFALQQQRVSGRRI